MSREWPGWWWKLPAMPFVAVALCCYLLLLVARDLTTVNHEPHP